MKKSLSKLLTLALALTMALSLTACGGGDKPAETPNTDKGTTQENAANDISTDEAEELPGKIDVELHTTYSIKDYCDITFSDPYVSDENATEHGASGVIITVPATVKITSSRGTRGLIMRAQLLDERGHSVQQTFTEKYDADELEPGKTYQASYSLFLSDKTEPEALYASIIMNMHEFSVPVDLTKIRPAVDEPEVPSEIEIVTGETYSIENLFDITFGELEYEAVIVGDYSTGDYQYRVYINLPATITVTGSETLDPFNKAFYENFTKKGYSDDGKEEFTLGMYFAGTNKLDKFEPGNAYELEMESDTFYEGVSTGTIKVNAFGKIFTMPYDYAEVLVPPAE